MINMSYCRFNNTNLALNECLDAIQDGEKLSDSEMDCCKRMFKNFIKFCYDNGIIEDEIEELNNRLDDFFETIEDDAYWN